MRMKRQFLCLLGWLFAVTLYAQVSISPNIIEAGYTGQVVVTFDPTKGNGGMEGATK